MSAKNSKIIDINVYTIDMIWSVVMNNIYTTIVNDKDRSILLITKPSPDSTAITKNIWVWGFIFANMFIVSSGAWLGF